MVTVAQNGTPIALKTRSCNTIATKYSLKLAPVILESKKKEAPVL